MPGLGGDLHGVHALLHQLRVDGLLCGGDLGLERGLLGEVDVALGAEGGDGGVHLVGFGGFFGDRLGVGVRFYLEYFNVLFLHSLVLYEILVGTVVLADKQAHVPWSSATFMRN